MILRPMRTLDELSWSHWDWFAAIAKVYLRLTWYAIGTTELKTETSVQFRLKTRATFADKFVAYTIGQTFRVTAGQVLI